MYLKQSSVFYSYNAGETERTETEIGRVDQGAHP